MAEQYRGWSPYNYAVNNPVSFIDPDGRMTYDWQLGAYRDNGGQLMNWGDAMNTLYGGLASNTNDHYSSTSSGGDVISFISNALGTGAGGGSATASDPTPKSNTGPGVIRQFINWLFGKKSSNKVIVGQAEGSFDTGTRLFGLIRNANVNANGESPLEAYRNWRDDPFYHEGENWADKFARNVNSSHMEILQDEGSGGGLMFGGFGNHIAVAEELSITSKISAEARLQGFKSLNSGIDPTITANYLEQMMNGTFNKTTGVAGFKWEGKFYLNDGNHRMNSAIQYKILTGDYKYMDILMRNAKFDNANPINYGKVYRFPVKPTR